MQFIDGGKRFICCFCEAATEGLLYDSNGIPSLKVTVEFLVPTEYFNHLDHTGRRIDYYQRPELCLGAYEIAATKKYCKVGLTTDRKTPPMLYYRSRMRNGPKYQH